MAPKTRKTIPKTTHKAKHEQLKRRLEHRRIRNSHPLRTTGYRGFLALPAEIKNTIYDAWAATDQTIFLRPSGPDFLTSTHPAAQLCRQTRDEFLSIITQNATFAAKTVVASVQDFNFYYLEQFLNLVAADPRADIGHFEDRPYRSANRRIFAQLTLTDTFFRDPPVKNLVHWLRWLDSFEFSYGLGIEYEFRRVAEPEAALGIFKQFARAHKNKGPLGEVAERLGEYVEWMREARDDTEEGEEGEAGSQEEQQVEGGEEVGEDGGEAENEDVENEPAEDEGTEDDEMDFDDGEEMEDEPEPESDSDMDEDDEEYDDPENEDDPERRPKLVYDKLTPEVEEKGWADAEEDW